MELLIATGTKIVGKAAQYTVEPIARQVGSLIYYRMNLENLRTQLDKLSACEIEVKRKVDRAEHQGLYIEADVVNWLKIVRAIIEEAHEFLNDELHAETKCIHHLCCLKIRHHSSRKSIKLKDKIVVLSQEIEKRFHEDKLFTNDPYDVTRQEKHSITTEVYTTFHSRISTVNKIMDELRNPNTDMVVVRGVSGVGKTTIAEQVLRKAHVDKLFDDVVMIRDVKQNPDLKRIQQEIATKLDLGILEDHTLAERAPIICDRIKYKKTLVILDDVWEAIDLGALGLPRLVSCKVLFTCRSEGLPHDMGMHKDFSLDVLDEEESWSLFENMAGSVVKSEPIRSIAIQVAKKCGGLPVSVVTVASALKDKSLHEWKDALGRLKMFDSEGLTAKAHLALEWNFSMLDGDEPKELLLLCADTIVNNNSIRLRDLLKYGMGLNLFRYVHTLEEAQEALYSLVEKLKDFSLLVNNEDDASVRMHDLVRDVATKIASRDHHVLSIAYGGELKVWPETTFLEKCTRISLDCCSIPRLPEVLPCPNLKMFFLGCNDDSLTIPSRFFEEMKQLKVLDLTKLTIPSLPPSLQFLENLQTLCLDRCKLGDIALVGELRTLEILSFMNSDITHLPKEIGQLTRLRLLDLANCSQLEVIPPNVLSSLRILEDLRMRNSFKQWEGEGVIGKGSNASLSELEQLSRLTALEIHIPDAHILPEDLFSKIGLERYQILIGDAWKWDNTNKTTLKVLKIATSNELDQGLKKLLRKSEVLYLDGTKGVRDLLDQLPELKHLHVRNIARFTKVISEKVVLVNLTNLSVDRSDDLKFLLSSSMARGLAQLKHLCVSKCAILEEIVSTEGHSEENAAGNMFCKLEHLELRDLPRLARFCSGTCIKFLSLEKLDLENCTELGGFISDCMSGSFTSSKEAEERDSKEVKLHYDTAARCALFDEKASFPLLKRLAIDGLGKIKSIWHTQIAADSFCQLSSININRCDSLKHIFNDGSSTALKGFDGQTLNSLEIGHCGSLKSIFPASVARVLRQLEKLEVVYCEVLVEIVAREEKLETNISPRFVFPRTTSVEFRHLPLLKNFYPGMHTSEWPLLEQLEIYGCHKLEAFAADWAAFAMFHEISELDYLHLKKPLFFINKDSFPNLEYLTLQLDELEIWNGPNPAEFFRRLKSIDFYRCTPFSQQAVVFFLQRLYHLEKVEVGYGPVQELFVDERNLEIRGVQSLPRVRYLRLDTMYNLRHLGMENSESACSVFPDLEILDVQFCQRLKNLQSSAICFQNLTILKVHSCGNLEYITTQLIAKSLMQLTRLEVVDCERMSGIIVASNAGAGGYDEIVFSRLQHLQIHGLPRLQGFCLGNCIVKFPSLETASMSHHVRSKIFPKEEYLHNVCITSVLDSEVDGEEPDSGIDDDGSSGTSGDDNDELLMSSEGFLEYQFGDDNDELLMSREQWLMEEANFV